MIELPAGAYKFVNFTWDTPESVGVNPPNATIRQYSVIPRVAYVQIFNRRWQTVKFEDGSYQFILHFSNVYYGSAAEQDCTLYIHAMGSIENNFSVLFRLHAMVL